MENGPEVEAPPPPKKTEEKSVLSNFMFFRWKYPIAATKGPAPSEILYGKPLYLFHNNIQLKEIKVVLH